MTLPPFNIEEILYKHFGQPDFIFDEIYQIANIRLGLSEGAIENDAMIAQAKLRLNEILNYLLGLSGNEVLVKLVFEDKGTKETDVFLNNYLKDKLKYTEAGKHIFINKGEEDGTYFKEEHEALLRWFVLSNISSEDIKYITDALIEEDLEGEERVYQTLELIIVGLGEIPWILYPYDDRGCDIFMPSQEMLNSTKAKFEKYSIPTKY